MKTIAIIGANGRLGSEALKAFFRSNFKVISVTRTMPATRIRGIKYRTADALNKNSLIKACQGVDLIFNALNLPYSEWDKSALTLAKNIVEAARVNGATHLFPGNVYNYGKGIAVSCDENTNPVTPTPKGAIRIEMEALFKRAAQTGDVRTIILRAGDFYGGDKSGSWFDMSICSKLDKGIFTYPGPYNVLHTWAYLPDLAATFVKLANVSEKLDRFEIFTFAGHALTGNQMVAEVQKTVNLPLRRAGLPWRIIRLCAPFVPSWRAISELSYLWVQPHSLSDVKLKSVIGDIPYTAPNDAIQTSLRHAG